MSDEQPGASLQGHPLTGSGIESITGSGLPASLQGHPITGSDLGSSITGSGVPGSIQGHPLTGSGIESITGSGVPASLQGHPITGSDMGSSITGSGVPRSIQGHPLTGSGLESSSRDSVRGHPLTGLTPAPIFLSAASRADRATIAVELLSSPLLHPEQIEPHIAIEMTVSYQGT